MRQRNLCNLWGEIEMMPKNIKGKGCFGCGILLSILLLAILIVPYIDYYFGLYRISQSLDIEPTMPALMDYFDQTFVPGKRREDISVLLQSSGAANVRIAEYRNDDIATCDAVTYFVGYWPLNRLNFHLCYDKELRLETYTLFDEDY